MFKIDSEFMKEKNRSISKVILKFPNLFKNILQNNILLTKLKENFVIKNKKDIVKINEDKDEIVNSKKEETQIEMKDIKVKEKSIAINQEEDTTPIFYLARGRSFACLNVLTEAMKDISISLNLDETLV